MTIEPPATGILLRHSYGDAMSYHVACGCGNNNCAHDVWIEADDSGVTVNTSTTQTTDFWTDTVSPRYNINNNMLQWWHWQWTSIWNGLCTRLRVTRDVWWHGKVKYDAYIVMDKQAALNYAATLRSAIDDVEKFASIKVSKP